MGGLLFQGGSILVFLGFWQIYSSQTFQAKISKTVFTLSEKHVLSCRSVPPCSDKYHMYTVYLVQHTQCTALSKVLLGLILGLVLHPHS